MDKQTQLSKCIMLELLGTTATYDIIDFFNGIDSKKEKELWRQTRAQEALPVFKTMSLPAAALKCTLAVGNMLYPQALLHVELDTANFLMNGQETTSDEIMQLLKTIVKENYTEELAFQAMWQMAVDANQVFNAKVRKRKADGQDPGKVHVIDLVQHVYNQAKKEVNHFNKKGKDDLEQTFKRILQDYYTGGYYKGRFNISSDLYAGPRQKLADALVLASFCDMAL